MAPLKYVAVALVPSDMVPRVKSGATRQVQLQLGLLRFRFSQQRFVKQDKGPAIFFQASGSLSS